MGDEEEEEHFGTPRRIPPYVNPNAQHIDEDHDCRDDAFLDCPQLAEAGQCDPRHRGDLVNARELCPVTCGISPCMTGIYEYFTHLMWER